MNIEQVLTVLMTINRYRKYAIVAGIVTDFVILGFDGTQRLAKAVGDIQKGAL
jgi:hypothetical protein